MIRPIHDRIFIRRFPEVTKVGMIELAPSAYETLYEGEVVAVGPGKRTKGGGNRPMSIKIGDKISFGFRANDTIKVDGEELVCLREADVIGWIE